MRRLVVPVVLVVLLVAASRSGPPVVATSRRLPRTAVAPPDVSAGETLVSVMEATAAIKAGNDKFLDRLHAALGERGPPQDDHLGAWRPFAAPIAQIEEVLARPGLTLPDSHFAEDGRFIAVQSAGSALLVRGWDRARSISPEAGAADMVQVLTLGARLTDAAEDVLPLIVGLNLQKKAVRELGELLDWAKDPQANRVALAGLLANRSRSGAMARILPRACASDKAMTAAELAKPTAVLDHLGLTGDVEFLGLSPVLANAVAASVAYDAADTRGLIDARCAATKVHLRLPPALRPAAAAEEQPDGDFRNVVGRELVNEIGDYAVRISESEDYAHAAHSVLLVAVAARLFVEAEGRAPARVAELVPDWLPAPPADPFRSGGVQIRRGEVCSAGLHRENPRLARLSIPIE